MQNASQLPHLVQVRLCKVLGDTAEHTINTLSYLFVADPATDKRRPAPPHTSLGGAG